MNNYYFRIYFWSQLYDERNPNRLGIFSKENKILMSFQTKYSRNWITKANGILLGNISAEMRLSYNWKEKQKNCVNLYISDWNLIFIVLRLFNINVCILKMIHEMLSFHQKILNKCWTMPNVDTLVIKNRLNQIDFSTWSPMYYFQFRCKININIYKCFPIQSEALPLCQKLALLIFL